MTEQEEQEDLYKQFHPLFLLEHDSYYESTQKNQTSKENKNKISIYIELVNYCLD